MTRSLIGYVLVWVLGLTGGTYLRAQTWTSELTLWTDATERAPAKPRPFINLGLAKEYSGDVPGAFHAQQTALALSFQPRLTAYQQRFSRVASETNLARLLAQNDQEGAALQMLNQVIAEFPTFPHALYNRGVLYAKIGRCLEGVPDIQRARQLEPSFDPGPPCP